MGWVFLLKRSLTLLLTLLAASLLVFGALELLPGNAAQALMGPRRGTGGGGGAGRATGAE